MDRSPGDFGWLAKQMNLSYGTLLDLNPELQRGMTPPGKHIIRIPAAMVKPKSEE